MTTSCCCHPSHDVPATSRRRRFVRFANWIVPGVILVAMPKCPVCVAAYVALFTGYGISLTAAGTLRTALIATCVAALTYVALKTAYRRWLMKFPQAPLAA